MRGVSICVYVYACVCVCPARLIDKIFLIIVPRAVFLSTCWQTRYNTLYYNCSTCRKSPAVRPQRFYVYIYICVCPTLGQRESSTFIAFRCIHSFRMGYARGERRRACCCITWFWNVRLKDVARRAWIKRDRFVLGTETRRGEGEGEGPSIVPKLCEPVPLRLEARLESFSGWRLPDYDFDWNHY